VASYEESGGYCKRCNDRVLVRRQATNHILHLVLSVLTGGLWLLVWIASAIKVGGWRCSRCGSRAGAGSSFSLGTVAAVAGVFGLVALLGVLVTRRDDGMAAPATRPRRPPPVAEPAKAQQKTARITQPKAPARPPITAADIYWDDETRQHRDVVLQLLNKIRDQNERCREMDLGTVSQSGTRGTREAPVWYVTCLYRGDAFNEFFSAADLAPDRSVAAVTNVPHSVAVNACEREARSRAQHPETVDFSRILDVQTVEHANGNTTVYSTFTAKNAFGVGSKYRIRCLVKPSGAVDNAEVSPSE